MKRIAIALVVGIGLLSTLCLGLALAVTFTPLRAQAAQIIEQVAQRANLDFDWRSSRIAGEKAAGINVQDSAEEGILIAGVLEGSPADQAGLRRGDILMKVDGQAVNTLPDLMQALSDVNSGDSVELSVQRGDESLTLTAQAADTNSQQENGLLRGSMLGIVPCTDGEMLRSFGAVPDFERVIRGGVQITNVVSGSPAEEAGLKVGEWITAVNGSEVGLPDEVTRVVQQSEPGDPLTLTVEDSEGQQREVTVTLAQKPDGDQAWLGVSLGSNFEHRMPFFGDEKGGPLPEGIPALPDGYTAGAIVKEVTPGSAAEAAGLQTGQVILEVDGQKVTTAEALKAAIAAHKPGDEVTLIVSGPDDATTQEVTVTLGENPDQAGAAYLGINFGFFEFRQETTPGGREN